ncbi:hypothetical protein DFJ74DRAFT_701349 [Hyaloraphidium curvatum]|nr:hypothetical protein DFJ74DRAFT_701349 [Hyaloraphidium curvatum]
MRLPRRAAALAAIAFSLALSAPAAAAPLRPRQAPLARVGTTGNTALACQDAPIELSCGTNQVLAVSSVFYGRDIAGVPESAAVTCYSTNGNISNTACSASPATTAAIALDLARKCNGQQSCSPGAAADYSFRAMWGDPCPGVNMFLRISYDCLASDLFAPVVPIAPPASHPTLGNRRPATFSGDKCPLMRQAVSNNTLAALQWQARLQPGNLTLDFIDVDIATPTAPPDSPQPATRIRAVNAIFHGTKVSIGESSGNFTDVEIVAANIIALNGSILSVHSSGPDAAGTFGPRVVIRAARVFGTLSVEQNRMPAGYPQVNQGAMDLASWPLNPVATPFNTACEFFDPNEKNGWFSLYMKAYSCSALLGPNGNYSGAFFPFCVSYTGSNPQSGLSLYGLSFYGSQWAKAPVTNDGAGFSFNTDRIAWPGKPARGSLAKQVLASHDAEGTIGTGGGGITGTADYTIQWDWTGVWGVQVEVWGFGRNAPGAARLGSRQVCDVCSNINPETASKPGSLIPQPGGK